MNKLTLVDNLGVEFNIDNIHILSAKRVSELDKLDIELIDRMEALGTELNIDMNNLEKADQKKLKNVLPLIREIKFDILLKQVKLFIDYKYLNTEHTELINKESKDEFWQEQDMEQLQNFVLYFRSKIN